MKKINEDCLKQIFHESRTHSTWFDKAVDDHILFELYDLMKLGPTSANCSPVRILFIKTKEAKERLKPHLAPGNIEKTMLAPVTAILGYDLEFYKHLPHLFPFTDAKSWFEGKDDYIAETAFRNSSLQGAYFIIAARACGLDCGPMSGFSEEGVNKEFFLEGKIKSNFLCNLGYGNPEGLPGPRAPRFEFEEVCKIL